MSQKWMAIVTAMASVSLITALGIGVGPPVLLAAGTVAVAGLLLVVSSKRADRPSEYLYGGTAPRAWTWWTVLAVLLAGAYVIAAAGQLIETPKATNLGALGIAFGFATLIGMGLRLRLQSKITGNWMVIFATTPALMFFWMILPPLMALAIIIGAVMEISRATPKAPATA